MEIYDPLLRILKRGYGRFRTRRIAEVLVLSASVIAPFVLGALVLGLLLGGSRWGAWLVPIIVFAGLVFAAVRGVRFLLSNHLNFGAFLVLVEQRAGLARNELINALQLGRRASVMRDPLARDVAAEVLRRGAETAKRIPFGKLAPVRSLRGPGGQAAGSLVLILVLALLAPGAVLRTAGQILHPGTVPVAEGVQIIVEPGDCTLERGRDLRIRARLVGLDEEAILFHRAGGGAWQRGSMEPEGGSFAATLLDLQGETEYAVAAGMHRSDTYRITLVEPLRATGYEKRTRFPAYTGLAPEKVLSPHASIAALRGSEVDLLVSVSRGDATGRLLFDSGQTIPLAPAGESVLSALIPVATPELFHVELESPLLAGARWTSETFHIDPIADRMPSIYLLAPGEQVDLPPEMRLVLEIDCADDFGITRLDLSWRRNDEEPTTTTITRWTAETEARVLHPWNLETITMVPGDRIVYRLELTDNDTVSGPKMTRSPEYIIRFPSIEEMYAQQEEERRSGIEDLRESFDQQMELREQLDRITKDLRRERGMEWEQKQEVEEFLQKQEEILDKMEDLTEAMDRQLDRMQQGELFSPEMIAKVAQIQEMVRQIQAPEFHERLQKLREAMESLNPQDVRKAIEEMKLTQKEIEQGLDRTIQMLERMLAEEKLDELIQRAERLQEEQDRIGDQASRTDDREQADSTAALSEEEKQALSDAQEAAREQLEELRKQMEELRDLASRSHQEMADALEGEPGKQSEETLESAGEEMEASRQAMQMQNRQGAMKSSKRASARVKSFAQQMRSMQQQIESQQVEELSRRLLALAGNLVDMSQREEDLVENANQRNTRDLAVDQDRLARAAGSVVDQIYELARETPFITPAQSRALGEILRSLSSATDAFEIGRRSGGSAIGGRAQVMMDEVVASLLESNDSMCSNSSSSCNKPNPGSAMMGLSNQQQGVNRGTRQLMGEMQGSRLSDQGVGRLEQLAAQQEQIRQGLREVAGSMQDQRNVLGRLDELGSEMEEVVEEMRDRNVDERLLRRQERILSRLLTAQRSIRRQDFEEQRRSRTGVDPSDPVSPGAVEVGLSQREQIRRGILKGSQDPIPDEFRRLVDEYFRALMGEAR